MIELIAVMGVISLMAGLTVPAVKGLSGSNNLNTGARKFADLLSLARSEAIARHAVVRFVVAKEWESKADASLRNVSLWVWNAEVERYFQLSPWQEMPVGVTLEQASPAYLHKATYAREDRAAVRGECVFTSAFKESAEFNAGTEEEPIRSRFIEFLPSGTMRIPGGTSRQAIFVATQGYSNHDGTLTYTTRGENGPANWAQVNVDTLTGRVHVYRP
ncbi:MAG: prepilin-type N-terminal cleavage/methylation protein [Chthoniobacteraceae bacterium]|nr:prepilin-type N-terminal cleavage/methylation protein [Chthoniobacteraceae bacterium]MDB6172647.1 prepilin-type N-terminal cleavage/methylation protein [Chthoniobacteraceae bacterium]